MSKKVSKPTNEGNNANLLLAAGWYDLSQLPEYFSFRCIIRFKQFGMEGVECKHISTGYWSHVDKCFLIDNQEMKNMTPFQFIPVYDDIL